ncbi:MAG: hypothetical protein BGO07_02235 [Alphaproteobacteria bacterium 40-19]|nr:MAG: hypothetical protein BGO07_02235 [Alphaproteobacteria bacterium 40-19]
MSSKSLLNLAIALLPSAAMALTLPKTPCVLNLFWATGYQDLLEDMGDAVSAKIPSSVKMPEVDIGGQDFGSKRTFDAVKEFLKKCQEQKSPTTILFSIDKPTYWANKEQFDALAAEYPQNFRPFFLDDFIKHPEVQEHSKVLPFFNKTFRLMPVTGANLFRLLAPCFPKALKLEPQFTSNPWSWMYIDIDNFIDGMDQDHKKKGSSLKAILRHSSSKKSLITVGFPGLDNNALRIEVKKNPEKLEKYKEYITELKPPLNKQPKGFPYYDALSEIIKGRRSTNLYLDKNSIKSRISFSNPSTSSPSISGRFLLKKLIQILPSTKITCPNPLPAVEWLGGIYLTREDLSKEAFVNRYTNGAKSKQKFLNKYMESLTIINDLLKFAKVDKWLLWQKSYLQKELPSINYLKELTNVALQRLIEINPFSKNQFKELSKKDINPNRIFSRIKGRQPDTAVSGILALAKKLSKAYPDHPLVAEYRKKNKACRFLKQDPK